MPSVEAEKRAELALQMGLLAEHEVTRIVELLDAMAQHMGLQFGRGRDIEEAIKHVGAKVRKDELPLDGVPTIYKGIECGLSCSIGEHQARPIRHAP